MNPVISLILITLLPFLELRASIPYGILATNLHWVVVFLICVITNIILGSIIYLILDKFVHLVIKINFIGNIYKHFHEKTQKKIHKYVEKWGWLGLAVFIGIPAPGSGVYSGALAAYILGMSHKRFLIAAIVGVIIAGIIVTAISLSGAGIGSIFIKPI